MVFKFKAPGVVLKAVAARAKAKRLAANLTRRSLAVKAGVSEASIKRFETTGEISFHRMLKLAFALDCMAEFEQLFLEDVPQSIADLKIKPKQRGSL